MIAKWSQSYLEADSMETHRPRFSDMELEILENLVKDKLGIEERILRSWKTDKNELHEEMTIYRIKRLNKLRRKLKRNQTRNRKPVGRKSYQELVAEGRGLVAGTRRG